MKQVPPRGRSRDCVREADSHCRGRGGEADVFPGVGSNRAQFGECLGFQEVAHGVAQVRSGKFP